MVKFLRTAANALSDLAEPQHRFAFNVCPVSEINLNPGGRYTDGAAEVIIKILK